MSTPDLNLLPETDSRFPSGRWTGFFLQPVLPGKSLMELHLAFANGIMKGEGRDRVGSFLIAGRYELVDGKCHWTKQYVGLHSVYYKGFNEGKGIWGVWEIPQGPGEPTWRGGFHIWPEGMSDPTNSTLNEEKEEPRTITLEAPAVEEELVPVGAGTERWKG